MKGNCPNRGGGGKKKMSNFPTYLFTRELFWRGEVVKLLFTFFYL